jgi:hypothetical protein
VCGCTDCLSGGVVVLQPYKQALRGAVVPHHAEYFLEGG